MIDADGYRPNVGIVLLNDKNQVFWGKRTGEDSWQFPQGGQIENESLDECMFRELNEELGLFAHHVKVIGKTTKWLYYDVPGSWNRPKSRYRGQKQIWYLLGFIGQDYQINLRSSKQQEFDAWRWIDYWEPLETVVRFKQQVYKEALNQLAKFISLEPHDK